ncbi:Glucanosyltransferase-domain-containing protein [Mycena sanguinolenta]|nr:Glucanosyltransferase-domain-containing protein [Mycena sanguinolenta]
MTGQTRRNKEGGRERGSLPPDTERPRSQVRRRRLGTAGEGRRPPPDSPAKPAPKNELKTDDAGGRLYPPHEDGRALQPGTWRVYTCASSLKRCPLCTNIHTRLTTSDSGAPSASSSSSSSTRHDLPPLSNYTLTQPHPTGALSRAMGTGSATGRGLEAALGTTAVPARLTPHAAASLSPAHTMHNRRGTRKRQRWPRCTLPRLPAASTAYGAVQKVTRVGRYMYTADGNRFYVKGIVYQTQGAPSTFADNLANAAGCARDLPFLQQLSVNTIRAYSVDTSLNRDGCMAVLSGAGIYVILDLTLPLNGLIDTALPTWSTNFLDQYIKTINVFSKYDNVLAYDVRNEAFTSDATNAAPFIKAAARDIKAYLKGADAAHTEPQSSPPLTAPPLSATPSPTTSRVTPAGQGADEY